MIQVSVEDVKNDLPIYLQLVEAGRTVLITRAGKPLAELKPVPAVPVTPRPFGLCAGQFSVPDDFDDPLPNDIIADFENG